MYLFIYLIDLMNSFIVKNTHKPIWKMQKTVVLLQEVPLGGKAFMVNCFKKRKTCTTK